MFAYNFFSNMLGVIYLLALFLTCIRLICPFPVKLDFFFLQLSGTEWNLPPVFYIFEVEGFYVLYLL